MRIRHCIQAVSELTSGIVPTGEVAGPQPRLRVWKRLLTLVLGGLGIGGFATGAQAQQPFAGGGLPPSPSYGVPGDFNFTAPGFQGAANPDMMGGVAPTYNGYGPAGYPATGNPYPAISPFEGPLGWERQTLESQDGFWFNKVLTQNRKYHFSVSAVYGITNDPRSTLIGTPNTYPNRRAPSTGTGATTGTTTTTGTININTGGLIPGSGSSTLITYPNALGIGDLTAELSAPGARVAWGFDNADETGMQVTLNWLDQSNSDLYIGDPRLNVNDPSTYLIRAGLPISNPTLAIDPANPVGFVTSFPTTQRYDLFYNFGIRSQTYSGALDIFTEPIYERRNIKVRPLLGVRAQRVEEQFYFRAADSNTVYAYNTITGRVGAGTAGGTTTTTTVTLNPADIYESELFASTRNNFVGPEIGLRLDVGGDHFKITSDTAVGYLVGQSRRNLSGRNIGFGGLDPNSTTTTGTTTSAPAPLRGPAFAEEANTTYGTPGIVQSLNFRAPILAYVPLIKKIKLFEAAQFQFGYTLTVLTDVYRPSDNVIWQGHVRPATTTTTTTSIIGDTTAVPQLANQKSVFLTNAFNFGVEWNY